MKPSLSTVYSLTMDAVHIYCGLIALGVVSLLLFLKTRRRAKREHKLERVEETPLVRPSYTPYRPPTSRTGIPSRKPTYQPAQSPRSSSSKGTQRSTETPYTPPTPAIHDSGLVPIDFRSLSFDDESSRSKPFEGGGGDFGGSGASASYDASSGTSSSDSGSSSSSSD